VYGVGGRVPVRGAAVANFSWRHGNPCCYFRLFFLRTQLVDYDKQCCLFLERMRLSSSFDIVQRFKFFINEFVGTQYGSAEECSQALHTFIEVSS
jgi:hypothetical protein